MDLEITDDVTGQVKVGMLDISDFVTLASKFSMLSANKANESAWVMYLAFVSLPVLCDHNTAQGHLRSPGKKVKPKNKNRQQRKTKRKTKHNMSS